MADMTVTNQTANDYWFGPLHLLAGVGQTLVVDVTTNASLYLTNDGVADTLNNLYNAGKITVTSPPSPFPRPTGVPQILHGDGSPEGAVYAPQGSTYLRRDNASASNAVYTKTTGITVSTGWIALAANVPTPAGTTFPGSPADGDGYIYVADATNGIFWQFRWYATGGYWAFIGGPPLFAEITTTEASTSTSFGDLTTVGPSIVLPFAADYDVAIGAGIAPYTGSSNQGLMSYAIGGTAASAADQVEVTANTGGALANYDSVSRPRRKTGLSAVTLTAKYLSGSGSSVDFKSRWMTVWPVKK